MNFNEEHFPAGLCRLKAKTKRRVGLDGNTNRGLLIINEQNQERWLSVTDTLITELPLGSPLYFNGAGARPSLTIPNQQVMSKPVNNQIESNNNYTNQQQNSSSQIQTDISEQLLEKTCLILSNSYNLLAQLNPQLSEESLVKMAISASIAYNNQTKALPF